MRLRHGRRDKPSAVQPDPPLFLLFHLDNKKTNKKGGVQPDWNVPALQAGHWLYVYATNKWLIDGVIDFDR